MSNITFQETHFVMELSGLFSPEMKFFVLRKTWNCPFLEHTICKIKLLPCSDGMVHSNTTAGYKWSLMQLLTDVATNFRKEMTCIHALQQLHWLLYLQTVAVGSDCCFLPFVFLWPLYNDVNNKIIKYLSMSLLYVRMYIYV